MSAFFARKRARPAMQPAEAAVVLQRAFRSRRAPNLTRPFVSRSPLAQRVSFYPPSKEQKVVDTAQANYACDTTGSVTLLNGVANGALFTERIGRKICMTSVQIRGLIYPQDTITTDNAFRVMIVYDSQPNGALPAVTDVLLAATATSMLNLNNRDRFKVLMDKQGVCGAQDTATATATFNRNPGVINVKKWLKLNHETVFDGATAAIGDVQTGSLFLLTIGVQAVGGGSLLTASLRVRFTDG